MFSSKKLFSFILALLCIGPIVVLGQGWDEIASNAQDLLEELKRSHPEFIARLISRDSGAARSNYWTQLSRSQPSASSDTLPDELAQLLGDLGSSLNQLIQLLSSVYDIAPPVLVSDSASSTVLPITLFSTESTTQTTLATTTPAATTSVLAFSTTTSTSSGLPASSSTTAYAFSPQASNLNVVYYSQTDLTSEVALSQICNDPAIDLVILAFVTELFADAGEGWPAMNLASNCWAASAAQQAAGATGLLDCVGDGFYNQITTCQSQGKKVLLSLGGSTGNLAIPSDEKAVEAAHTLWSLFLGGSNATTSPIRPFGSVVLDGMDLDNEDPSNEPHLVTLMSTLRGLLATDTSKKYYLTAAPQCPQPDQSIPVPELTQYIDFFGVQFYNNPSCQLSSGSGFLTSLQSWSQALAARPGNVTANKPKRSSSRFWPRQSAAATIGGTFVDIDNGVTAPKLLIGTPAFAGAGSGFVSVAEYQDILRQVENLALPNVAGAMFWDGAYEIGSGGGDDQGGTTYAQVVREVFA